MLGRVKPTTLWVAAALMVGSFVAAAEQPHDWRFLSSAETLHSDEFAAPLRGLSLPRGVVDKIYNANARRVFPMGWSAREP